MTVPVYTVALDPPSAISGRTELNLNTDPFSVGQTGVDWGEAAIKAWLAEQLYGETPADFRVPNRIIQIPLLVGSKPTGSEAEEEEARQKLQQKVALFQRQGGVLMRQRANGEPLYADIVNASLTIPDVYGESGALEAGVTLHLECLPDFYGNEIELDSAEGTGDLIWVLKKSGAQAKIAGDYPARSRLVVEDQSGHNQRALIFGVRSTRYDPAASAALAWNASDLTPINGAAVESRSGTFSGKCVSLVPEGATWQPFLLTTESAVDLTHVGTFRVWARVQGGAGNRFRVAWGSGDTVATTTNEAVALSESSQWEMLDLGEIRIEEPPVGEHWWRAALQVWSYPPVQVNVDRIWLQPVDDGAGRLRATAKPESIALAPSKSRPGEANIQLAGFSGTAEWEHPNNLAEGLPTRVSLIPGGATKGAYPRQWGFGVPSEATVHGIEIRVTGRIYYGHIQMARLAALVGAAKAFSGTFGLINTFGGPTDLWGTTWTPAQINAIDFGPAIFVQNSGPFTFTAELIEVRMIVYYTYAGVTIATDAVIYSDRLAEVGWQGNYRQDVSTGAYARISSEEGDLLRVPPSGLEGRAVQMFLRNSRGNLEEADPGLDKLRAQLFYRPCYLGRI